MAISPQIMRSLLELDRDPPRRGARHVALYDRPLGVSRTARHVLGPDRNGRLGRQCDPKSEGRRRRRRNVRFAARRTGGPARRHGDLVLILTVWSRRIAGARLPRSAIGPGAESFLHRSRRLALHHGARPGEHPAPRSGGGFGDDSRGPQRDGQAARGHCRDRIEQSRHQRHGQSGGGDPGPGPPHAPGTADDPQLGGRPGGAERRGDVGCWKSSLAKTTRSN